MARRRENKTRAAVVSAAARSCRCLVTNIFEQATLLENAIRKKEGRRLIRKVVADLRHVPTYVFRFARALLAELIQERQWAPRQRPGFFRVVPCRGVH